MTPTTWEGFLAIRKARRAPLTVGALDGIRAEAGKAGFTLEAALLEAASRGWQSFRSDWVQRNRLSLNGSHKKSRHDLDGIDYSVGLGPNGEIL